MAPEPSDSVIGEANPPAAPPPAASVRSTDVKGVPKKPEKPDAAYDVKSL
jgi:hypothetical protein